MSEFGDVERDQSDAILIIGVGNEYRRDDGVGIEVARRIAALNLPQVRVMEHSGEGASLLECLAEADQVVLIDATQSGSTPGMLHFFDAATSPIPGEFFSYSTHAFSVAEAVELARTLRRLPNRLLIFGIEGSDFAYGLGLSAEAQKAANTVVERIAEHLERPVSTRSS